MSKIIVLMGAPGAGKGTQARLLQERLKLPQISTGDIFRALKTAHTPLAEEVRQVMAAGQLVSDDLTIRLVRERTAKDDCKNGYILDGFPRTPAQAAILEKLASEQGKQIIAILIDMPRDLLTKRMIGRRNCPVCGEIYNIYFKPSAQEGVCDLDGQPLFTRSDDNLESIAQRLALYDEKTRPLLDYYEKSGRLKKVDGSGTPEEVFDRIVAALGGSNPSDAT